MTEKKKILLFLGEGREVFAAPLWADILAQAGTVSAYCGASVYAVPAAFTCETVAEPVDSDAVVILAATRQNLERWHERRGVEGMLREMSERRNAAVFVVPNFEGTEDADGYIVAGSTVAHVLRDAEKVAEHLHILFTPKLLSGRKVLVTAGPTREPIDAVTYLTNPSSGKTGIAMARAAKRYGAETTLLLSSANDLPVSLIVDRVERFISVEELWQAVLRDFDAYDIIIQSAAVGDWEFTQPSDQKNKKSDVMSDRLEVSLKPTRDVLASMCALRRERNLKKRIIGFAAETHDLENYARRKLEVKQCDAILANWVSCEKGNAFGSDTNALVLFTKSGQKNYAVRQKSALAMDFVSHLEEDVPQS